MVQEEVDRHNWQRNMYEITGIITKKSALYNILVLSIEQSNLSYSKTQGKIPKSLQEANLIKRIGIT